MGENDFINPRNPFETVANIIKVFLPYLSDIYPVNGSPINCPTFCIVPTIANFHLFSLHVKLKSLTIVLWLVLYTNSSGVHFIMFDILNESAEQKSLSICLYR